MDAVDGSPAGMGEKIGKRKGKEIIRREKEKRVGGGRERIRKTIIIIIT